MKNERLLKISCISVIILLVISIVSVVSAYSAAMTLSTSGYLKAGEQVTVSVKLNNLDAGNGIDAMLATLDYDTDVFEAIATTSFKGANDWKIGVYNANTKKFTLTRNEKTTAQGEIITITFKAKQNITVDKSTITLKDITASGGDATQGGTGDIDIANASVIVKKQPVVENTTNEIGNTTNEIENTTNEIGNTTNNIVTNTVKNTIKNTTNTNITKLPQTGENTIEIIIALTAIAFVGIVFYVRYNNMKDIK